MDNGWEESERAALRLIAVQKRPDEVAFFSTVRLGDCPIQNFGFKADELFTF